MSTARVLLVEDDAPVRTALRYILEKYGNGGDGKVVVFEAADGKQALEILDQLAGQVDIIVLDLLMAPTNGWQFLVQLRWKIPVIILTGRSLTEVDLESLRAFDTVKVLCLKPVTPEDFVRALMIARAGMSEMAVMPSSAGE